MALGNYLILLAILVLALVGLGVHAFRYYRRIRREEQEEAEEVLVFTIVVTTPIRRPNPLIRRQYRQVPERYQLMEQVSRAYLENVYRITHGGKS